MNFNEQPGVNYAYKGVLRTDDILEVISALESFDPETPVCWTPAEMNAARGVWVRLGTYARKRGSFIDGQDLTLYVDSFYELAEPPKGRHEGLELNHSAGDVPADALAAGTVDELLNVLVELDYQESADDAEADGETVENREAESANPDDANVGDVAGDVAADADAADVETDADVDDVVEFADEAAPITLDNLAGKILIQPDADPLRHHSLSDQWRFMHYSAPDGSTLIVFD